MSTDFTTPSLDTTQVQNINRARESDKRKYYNLKSNAIHHLDQAGQHINFALAAIREIHDNKLWKLDDKQFATWEDFCTVELETSRQHIWRLLRAEDTRHLLESSEIAQSPVTSGYEYETVVANLSEYSTRHLAPVSPELQPVAINMAISAAQADKVAVTASYIEAAVDNMRTILLAGVDAVRDAAQENKTRNVSNHSPWVFSKAYEGNRLSIFDQLSEAEFLTDNENEPIKIVIYVPKPVTDTAPGADAENA